MTGEQNNAASATLESAPGQLRVQGEMTFATVAALHERALTAFHSAIGALIVDLAGVTRADSAGVALMIEWRRMAQAAGCQVNFTNIPAQLGRLIEVSGLNGAVRE